LSVKLRCGERLINFVTMQIKSSAVIIVGLNGALQKRFVLPSDDVLIPGNVHRASTVQTGVGGKGQDVAITLNCLSSESDFQLAHFIGTGSSGDEVFNLLVGQLGEESMELTVRTKSEMRTCTSIVASDETTELVEPSGRILEAEISELMGNLDKKVKNAAPALCIMGSMPPGCADETYAEIYARAAGPKTLCLVDSVAGVEPLINKMTSMETAGPNVFKVNASELCKLAGYKKSTNEASGVNASELKEAIALFLEKYSARKALRGLAITDGRHPGYFVSLGETDFSLYQLAIPSLDSGGTIYPIGAGDSVAGGTLAAWLCLTDQESGSFLSAECLKELENTFKNGESLIPDRDTRALVTAFSFGLACGSASKFCVTIVFDP
jgi:fructose-1-phosphate kinase PfkB-like protein